MEKITVLITSVGSTGAQSLIKLFREEGEYEVRIVGCDASPRAPGRYLTDAFFPVATASDPAYGADLLRVCRENRVGLILPVMEEELEVLSENSAQFAEFGLCLSAPGVIAICNDKYRSHLFLTEIGVPTPHLYEGGQVPPYPYVIKPRRGTGSKGMRIVTAAAEDGPGPGEEMIRQQCVAGKEYTVDGYGTLDGSFLGAVPRLRIATKGGLSVQTVTVAHEPLVAYTRKIMETLRMAGPVNIQFMETLAGEIYCIDINPRFGGAFIASVKAGLKVPRYLLDEIHGKAPRFDGYRVGMLMSRYWEEVYEADYLV